MTEADEYHGEVVFTRPTPEEMEHDAQALHDIRLAISKARSELQPVRMRQAPSEISDQDYRDAEAMLTGAIRALYGKAERIQRWADYKRRNLTNPRAVIREGFGDLQRERNYNVWKTAVSPAADPARDGIIWPQPHADRGVQ